MDENLLREKGFNPTAPVIAHVKNYGLRIGSRATMVPEPGQRTYGTVMALSDNEINTLYGEISVADYRPEAVTAITLENDAIAAIVYTLPERELAGRNSDYLASLVGVARKIGLPGGYIRSLEALGGNT